MARAALPLRERLSRLGGALIILDGGVTFVWAFGFGYRPVIGVVFCGLGSVAAALFLVASIIWFRQYLVDVVLAWRLSKSPPGLSAMVGRLLAAGAILAYAAFFMLACAVITAGAIWGLVRSVPLL